MRKESGKIVSIILAASLTLGVLTPCVATAKKAPKLSPNKVTVQVGGKKTIKVKNSKKKASWSIKSGKKYIALSSKKKASVAVKGKKVGKATVQAKVGGKKLVCSVTVVAAKKDKGENSAAATSQAVATPTATATGAPTEAPTEVPTEVPTATPTATPKVTPTPAPTMEVPDEPYPSTEFTYQGTSLEGIDTTKPMVAFTFDDGPIGNKATDNSMKIQALLKQYNAHASFFYIGQKINSAGTKDEIKQAKENGFDVGNHSWAYEGMDTFEKKAVLESIWKTDNKLREITGYDNFLFRAPNLATSQTMFDYIKKPFINCAVDSKDWANATADEIIANVKAAKDGDIVLMHETANNTVEALEPLLQYFQEQGFEVVSVTQLFAAKGKTLMTGQSYGSAR